MKNIILHSKKIVINFLINILRLLVSICFKKIMSKLSFYMIKKIYTTIKSAWGRECCLCFRVCF